MLPPAFIVVPTVLSNPHPNCRLDGLFGRRGRYQPEYKELIKSIDQFQLRLSVTERVKLWQSEYLRVRPFDEEDRIFAIKHGSPADEMSIRVNLDPAAVRLVRDCRALCQLSPKLPSVKVPLDIKMCADSVAGKHGIYSQLSAGSSAL